MRDAVWTSLLRALESRVGLGLTEDAEVLKGRSNDFLLCPQHSGKICFSSSSASFGSELSRQNFFLPPELKTKSITD